jgi:DNA-binding transcriptional MerR regulator
MTTIADLPDTPQHTIQIVCDRTGILPVTLRAWERRYKLLRPERTAGNYRLYSERDVAVLRWVKSRVEVGLTIGRVVKEFRALGRAGLWPYAAPAPPLEPRAESGLPPDAYAQRLYAALVAMDEAQAAEVLREAQAVFDLSTTCLGIIQPCLCEVGEAWYRGAIRIATEHFASQYLRGRLLALFQAYPMRHSAPRVVVGCAPNEHHDIGGLGGLILALFLRREGYRVEFLGANLHLEDLAHYARDHRPALICLSANAEASARELRQMEARLAGMRPRPKLGYGGLAFNLNPALRETVPGIFLGEDAGAAAARVRELLPM